MKRQFRLGFAGFLVAILMASGASPAAAKTVTKTKKFAGCVDVNVPVLDRQTSTVSLNIAVPKNGNKAQNGHVKVVGVGFAIHHTNDADLDISLVSPGGRAVALAMARGGSGNDYGGIGCTGGIAWFNDAFGTPISAGVPPFAGTFKPEQPLSSFNGSAARGSWTLVVSDHAAADTGSIGAFLLRVDYSYKQQAKSKGK